MRVKKKATEVAFFYIYSKRLLSYLQAPGNSDWTMLVLLAGMPPEAVAAQFHWAPLSGEVMAKMLLCIFVFTPAELMVATISGLAAEPANTIVCTYLPVEVPPTELTLAGM
jgi:hypothetical protein